jgi:hypothetical protein
MASILQVEQIQGPTSGANANKVIIPAGQTLSAPGHVIQVQSTPFNDYRYLTSSSWNTVRTVAITPIFATSKILVILNLNGCSTNGSSRLAVRMLRDSTEEFIVETYAGGADTGGFGSCSATWLDNPAKDTEVSYTVQAHAAQNTSYVTVNDYVSTSGRTQSSMTLMEIAQ